MRAGTTLLVFVLNIAAAMSILAARTSAGHRLAWLAAVVMLPIAGSLAWLLAGRRRHGAPSPRPNL